MIKIEVARVHVLNGTGNIRAFVDLSIEDSFVIKGVKVMEGEKGLYVAMPTEQGKDGRWYNVVIALSREVKDEVDRVVLEALPGDIIQQGSPK